jgi:hypothetical protein
MHGTLECGVPLLQLHTLLTPHPETKEQADATAVAIHTRLSLSPWPRLTLTQPPSACFSNPQVLEIIFKIIEEGSKKTLADGLETIFTTFADPSAPALWEAGPGAARELKEQSSLVRRAVGLARNLQDPLSFHAALFDSDAVLSLPLHPLQVSSSSQHPAEPVLAGQPQCPESDVPLHMARLPPA